jgi:hypothetical protein
LNAYLRVKEPARLRNKTAALTAGRLAVDRVVRAHLADAQATVNRTDQRALAQIPPAARVEMLAAAYQLAAPAKVAAGGNPFHLVKPTGRSGVWRQVFGGAAMSVSFRDDYAALFHKVMGPNVNWRAREQAGDIQALIY